MNILLALKGVTALGNLRIGVRLNLSFAMVLLIMGIGFGTTLLKLKDVERETVQVRDESVPFALLAEKILGQVTAVQERLTDASLTGNKESLQEAVEFIQGVREGTDKFRQMFARENDQEELRRINEIRTRFEAFLQVGQKMVTAYNTQGKAAGDILMEEFDKSSDDLWKALELLRKSQTEEANSLLAHDVSTIQMLTNLIWGIALLAMVTSILIAVLITRSITRPLATLSAFATQVAHGNLSGEIDIRQEDEVGHLGRAMSQMAASLRDLLSQMYNNANHLEKSAIDLSAVSAQVTGSATTMIDQTSTAAAAVEELSATMTQISTAAEQSSLLSTGIADGTTQASQNISTVTSAAQETASILSQMARTSKQVSHQLSSIADGAVQTNRSVVSAVSSMQEVTASFVAVREQCAVADARSLEAAQHIQASRSVITKLAQSAKQIGSVVDLINKIAGQTNMLALNASIEAAGAGNAGKGFAVVANEVKELAKQTGHATQMIQEQVSTIQQQSGEVAEEIQGIIRLIEGVVSANNEILHAVDAQSVAAEAVAQTMQSTSGETSAVTERLSEAAVTLSTTSAQVAQVFTRMMEVSQQMEQASQGMADVSNGVRETSLGARDITRSVTEAATATGEIASTMVVVNEGANQMQTASGVLDQRAGQLTGMAKELKGLVAQFRI
ncbi:MAG: methyl-accepting chemotaxis protein [Magnetococcales bacterium]|nr:methyl-accepting chemotaxis protein [Magnetococcales bacterium]